MTKIFLVAGEASGDMLGAALMRALRISDSAAIGMAAGVASHGVGAARAFQIDSTAGAFAGIAMGLNGALTSIILPLFRPLLGL